MYSSKPNGLPGNDDLGTMGAWYVFASIGLYPMIPGVGGFSANAPQFDEISIDFPKRKTYHQRGISRATLHKILKTKWQEEIYMDRVE